MGGIQKRPAFMGLSALEFATIIAKDMPYAYPSLFDLQYFPQSNLAVLDLTNQVPETRDQQLVNGAKVPSVGATGQSGNVLLNTR